MTEFKKAAFLKELDDLLDEHGVELRASSDGVIHGEHNREIIEIPDYVLIGDANG